MLCRKVKNVSLKSLLYRLGVISRVRLVVRNAAYIYTDIYIYIYIYTMYIDQVSEKHGFHPERDMHLTTLPLHGSCRWIAHAVCLLHFGKHYAWKGGTISKFCWYQKSHHPVEQLASNHYILHCIS